MRQSALKQAIEGEDIVMQNKRKIFGLNTDFGALNYEVDTELYSIEDEDGEVEYIY